VVRDITRVNGKDIQLVIHGEKTELDKRMIDELGDPLIHMVRNSADHGVETPEERIAAGKPPQGEIVLDAFHRGNSIMIQVKDNGRGLSLEKIRRKAIEKGIVSESDCEKMTPHQVYQLIWEPGFSTAEKITEISGRGMGMDIVRSKIEDLSGVVELDSVPGQGTIFTIKLPLTLAILPSLMAMIQGDVFALPIESVVEIVSVRRQDFSRVHGLRTATVRGRVVSVAMLEDVFTWKSGNDRPHAEKPEDAEESTLVIIGVAGRELGLCVDQLLGEEDVVIKSMAENYRNVEGVAGASILGDGRVALILDTSALIDMASKPRRQTVAV
jgi:two-component system chemotaxis sensor kinase CheA